MNPDCDICRPAAQWRVCELLAHSGLCVGTDDQQRLQASGQLARNGGPVDLQSGFSATDHFLIDGIDYRVDWQAERPQLVSVVPAAGEIAGPVRVHAGYHKCLTMYSRRVYARVCKGGRAGGGFRHYYHRADHFYHTADRYRITSISGHRIDLDRFQDIRVVRFIRDPRDLLVSGYFYHRRAGERWCDLTAPGDGDWTIVGGRVPSALRDGESFAGFLNRVSPAEGLLAEIEFRRSHFQSMLHWPDDPRVRLYRYEDILGNESACFADIARFLELPWLARLRARRFARRYRSGTRRADRQHIRNPAAGQWRNHFTPEVEQAFEEAYGDLLTAYGYRQG